MIRTQIYLLEQQLDMLRNIAHTEKSTVSQVVRNLIYKNIPDKNKKEQKKQLRKKYKNGGEFLMALAKDAEKHRYKGPKDLASNVDKYFYESI